MLPHIVLMLAIYIPRLTIVVPLLNFLLMTFSSNRYVNWRHLSLIVIANMVSLLVIIGSSFSAVMGGGSYTTTVGNWFTSSLLEVNWIFAVDAITYVMLIVVLMVSTLVNMYSTEYLLCFTSVNFSFYLDPLNQFDVLSLSLPLIGGGLTNLNKSTASRISWYATSCRLADNGGLVAVLIALIGVACVAFGVTQSSTPTVPPAPPTLPTPVYDGPTELLFQALNGNLTPEAYADVVGRLSLHVRIVSVPQTYHPDVRIQAITDSFNKGIAYIIKTQADAGNHISLGHSRQVHYDCMQNVSQHLFNPETEQAIVSGMAQVVPGFVPPTARLGRVTPSVDALYNPSPTPSPTLPSSQGLAARAVDFTCDHPLQVLFGFVFFAAIGYCCAHCLKWYRGDAPSVPSTSDQISSIGSPDAQSLPLNLPTPPTELPPIPESTPSTLSLPQPPSLTCESADLELAQVTKPFLEPHAIGICLVLIFIVVAVWCEDAMEWYEERKNSKH